jgi:Rod binding domain-containing protein
MSELTVSPLHKGAAALQAPLASRAPHVRKTADAAEKFESFVLQSFIQEMMPDNASEVYGSGIAGDFWKSMMSEKIAEQVAARGGIGIAETIREGRQTPVRPTGAPSLAVLSHLSTLNDAPAAHSAVPSEPGA